MQISCRHYLKFYFFSYLSNFLILDHENMGVDALISKIVQEICEYKNKV